MGDGRSAYERLQSQTGRVRSRPRVEHFVLEHLVRSYASGSPLETFFIRNECHWNGFVELIYNVTKSVISSCVMWTPTFQNEMES